MEYNEKKKDRNSINGYGEGYGYPIGYYGRDKHQSQMPKLEGSFWVTCREKAKGRHSFCDGE